MAVTDGACISANVARLRLDRRLTQEGLAVKAGLSRLALGRIERGVVVPRASTLQGLAGALDVPLGELVTPVRPLESVRFRAKAQLRSREQILAEVSKWIEAYAWLEAELGEQPGFGFGVGRSGDRGSQPVAVARAARLACGLTPDAAVRDICGLLEAGGVKLLLLETIARLVLRPQRRPGRWRPGCGREHLGSDLRGALDFHCGARVGAHPAAPARIPARSHGPSGTR